MGGKTSPPPGGILSKMFPRIFSNPFFSRGKPLGSPPWERPLVVKTISPGDKPPKCKETFSRGEKATPPVLFWRNTKGPPQRATPCGDKFCYPPPLSLKKGRAKSSWERPRPWTPRFPALFFGAQIPLPQRVLPTPGKIISRGKPPAEPLYPPFWRSLCSLPGGVIISPPRPL